MGRRSSDTDQSTCGIIWGPVSAAPSGPGIPMGAAAVSPNCWGLISLRDRLLPPMGQDYHPCLGLHNKDSPHFLSC
uniref:Uncharacterized protein n=1 Tax=Pyxicephalus adspersus TaxID=30357 RepID=A0AAV3AQ40_PYXAD|nr:TPA: hypothetical protein GDO54_011563 [Pyxicephalus adspersus]